MKPSESKVMIIFWGFWIIVGLILLLMHSSNKNQPTAPGSIPAESNYSTYNKPELTAAQAKSIIGMNVMAICSTYGNYNIHLHAIFEDGAQSGIDCENMLGFTSSFIAVQTDYDEVRANGTPSKDSYGDIVSVWIYVVSRQDALDYYGVEAK